MAWFKVDDGFYSSVKFLSIPREYQAQAAGAWLLCGTWSADKMTDGIVPYSIMSLWEFDEQVVHWLCKVGLWKHLDDGLEQAIRFHDWEDYQPTKEQLLAKNERISKARSEASKSRWSKDEAKRMQKNAKPMQNDAPVPEPVPEPLKNISSNKFDGNFETFWEIYPRKVGKATAKKAFLSAFNKYPYLTYLAIIEGAKRLASDPNLPEPAFIPHPTTWLNRGGWEDDPYPGPAVAKEFLKPSVPQPPTKEELKSRECQTHHGYPMPCTRCEEDNA